MKLQLSSRNGVLLDRVGATASVLCAIHCALLPLVVGLLPLIGLASLADERIEWALLSATALVAISSLCFGYRRHRSVRALQIAGIGLALLVGAHIGSHFNMLWAGVLAGIGGLTVAAAHRFNLHLCHTCPRCQHDRPEPPGCFSVNPEKSRSSRPARLG